MRILKKKYWPGMVVVPETKSHEGMIRWCQDTVGKGQYYVVEHYSNRTVYFKNEEDATMFALKWV